MLIVTETAVPASHILCSLRWGNPSEHSVEMTGENFLNVAAEATRSRVGPGVRPGGWAGWECPPGQSPRAAEQGCGAACRFACLPRTQGRQHRSDSGPGHPSLEATGLRAHQWWQGLCHTHFTLHGQSIRSTSQKTPGLSWWLSW